MDKAVYTYGDKLYLNITNKCRLDCAFCIRKKKQGLGDADSLGLEEEPSCAQILELVRERGPEKFSQIVFCGYGEPTERLHELLTMAKELKKLPGCPPLRLDTNGLSSLAFGYDTAPDVAERFDAVSVSLNAPTAQEYAAVCPSPWGEDAFFAMLDFAKKIRKLVRDTQLTVVDYIGEEPVQRAKELAARLDIPLRVRQYQE